MSTIDPTASAANCSACSWIAKTAKSAKTAVVVEATKIANLVSTAFRALAQYANTAFCYVKNDAAVGLNIAKANPQIVGGLAVLALATATAAYAYRTRS